MVLRCWTWMVKMACERDDSAFMLVAATALFLMPVSSSSCTRASKGGLRALRLNELGQHQ